MSIGPPTSTNFLLGAVRKGTDVRMPREDARSLTRLCQIANTGGKLAQIAADLLEPEG
jgi:hypothetical protein